MKVKTALRQIIVSSVLAAMVAAPALGLSEARSTTGWHEHGRDSFALPGAERLVLAFYYAWFDENTWRRDVVPDMPVSPYHSADRNVIARHVDEAKRAAIDALVLSWLGPNNPTDSNLATLLSVAQEKGLRVGLDFETNSPFYDGQEDIVGAVRYAIGKYAGHPQFLRHDGRPVIFFWHTRQLPVGTWQRIRDQVDPQRSTMWIAEGDDPSYLQAFDGIHMYSIAWSTNPASTLSSFAGKVALWQTQLGTPKAWVATVMPGYDDRTTGRPNAFIRDRQDGQYYTSTWNAAMATSPDWIVITSFNEWVEGSQIEPSVTYGDKYLNLTRDLSTQFKAASRPLAARATGAPDYDVPNGHFFTQTSGRGGGTGFLVSNDGGIRFWDELSRLGGLQAMGYPISRRFSWDGFVVQAMQKGVVQWRPEAGRAYLVNVFDQMSAAGKDEWLLGAKSVPKPLGPEFDAGRPWAETVQARLALLDANSAIKRRYLATRDAMTSLGLPTSRVEDFGNHYSIRLQRAVIQQWKIDVPWARTGQVVIANGGDIGAEAGLYPAEAMAPQPAP
ncbi:MAG: glycoside hydrolase family 99-like domain-containing protein [Chloroflexi bacterium]|nr:glycoside hydrolase family 99-like domain-containing protein [Chloroflexota bacterium]